MKNLVLGLFVTFSALAAPAISHAASIAEIGAKSELPVEVSALLLSDDYARVVAERVRIANESGRLLRVTGFAVLSVATETFAYVALSEKIAADVADTWVPAGNIVGNVKYGPLGEVLIEGAYYQPAGGMPGRDSEGND